MKQSEKAAQFRSLHVKGDPLVLYNIWDAGGAKALADAGAAASATGSWALAAAHGFDDGEAIPLEFVLQIVARIASSVAVPLTVDFEGGYATEPEAVGVNVSRVIKAGAVGVNFEDRIVEGNGLYSIETQVARIKAIREAANAQGIALFINARTDLFLGSNPVTHKDSVAAAIDREAAYAEAGADGFFVPGLTDLPMIEQLTAAASLPVNVMMMGTLNSIRTVADVGVSRASFGPGSYVSAMSDLAARYHSLT